MNNISHGHQQLLQYISNNKQASDELTAHNSNQGFIGSMS